MSQTKCEAQRSISAVRERDLSPWDQLLEAQLGSVLPLNANAFLAVCF